MLVADGAVGIALPELDRPLPTIPWPLAVRLALRSFEEPGRQLETDRSLCVPPIHWRDCHFVDALSPSLLIHLLKVDGGAAE